MHRRGRSVDGLLPRKRLHRRYRSKDEFPNDPGFFLDAELIWHKATTQELRDSCQIHNSCYGSCPGQEIVTDSSSEQLLKDSNAERFEHLPLPDPSTMIRLLVVKPTTFRSDILECDLISVALDDCPSILMSRIYSQATHVAIYLGEVGDEWVTAWDLVHKLSRMCDYQRGADAGRKMRRDELWKRYRLPPPDDAVWGQFLSIFKSPWFQRTWTIQELALARQPVMFYGKYPLLWVTIVKAAEFFNKTSVLHHIKFDATAIIAGYARMEKIFEIFVHARFPDETWKKFVTLLYHTSEFSATDPRDKVIGILGLVGKGLTSQRVLALANYHNTVDEVYHTTAVHLVDLGAAGFMIHFAGLHRRSLSKHMPSWVPDWTAQTQDFGVPPLFRHRPGAFRAASHLKAKIYIEGRDSERQSLSKPLPTKLVISGAIVDSIKFIGISGSCVKGPGKRNFKEWYNSARLCIKQVSNSIDTPGPYADMEDAFCRTLILNDLHDHPSK
jgi:hypothetical protein